jgi:hypothetical protein
MNKSSANCMSRISYTCAGNDSGKLPGVTKLVAAVAIAFTKEKV